MRMFWVERFVVDYDGGVLELLNKNNFQIILFHVKNLCLQTITNLLLPLRMTGVGVLLVILQVDYFVSNFLRSEI